MESVYISSPPSTFPSSDDISSTQNLVPIKKKSNKIRPISNSVVKSCCVHLDEFCTDVEIESGRKIRVCYIPGNKRLSPTILKCHENKRSVLSEATPTTTKLGKSKVNLDKETNIFSSMTNSSQIEFSSTEIQSEDSIYFAKTLKSTINETAVFMIHGVGGEFKVWSPQITFLNNFGFTVVALNLIGHGGSSKPRDQAAYTFEKMSKDVFAIFDKFMMHRNVVIGHSYGCCFAALLARQKPDYIHCLVMISGGAPIPLGPQLGIFCLPLCCLQCIKCILYREFLSRSFHKPNRNNLCHLTAINVPIFVLKNTLNGQRWDEGGVNFYSLIASPTLLIQGKKDRLISVDEVHFMKNVLTIKTSSLVMMEDVGHMVMLESPDDLNSLIAYFMEEFLDKQFASTATNSAQ